jgi:hypothetical protein
MSSYPCINHLITSYTPSFSYLWAYIQDTLLALWVTMVKPDINSVEIHPQWCHNRHPVDRALVDTGSVWSPNITSKFLKKCFHVSDRCNLRFCNGEWHFVHVFIQRGGLQNKWHFELQASMHVLERERPKLMNETDITHHH